MDLLPCYCKDVSLFHRPTLVASKAIRGSIAKYRLGRYCERKTMVIVELSKKLELHLTKLLTPLELNTISLVSIICLQAVAERFAFCGPKIAGWCYVACKAWEKRLLTRIMLSVATLCPRQCDVDNHKTTG